MVWNHGGEQAVVMLTNDSFPLSCSSTQILVGCSLLEVNSSNRLSGVHSIDFLIDSGDCRAKRAKMLNKHG
jgi:hypothetical protein